MNPSRDLVFEGEIFRSGSYPDKGVVATPEDLVRLASGFTSAPTRIQHTETAFDEALAGYGLERVEARDGGTWLWGRARFPCWIEDALGGTLRVSLGIAKVGLQPTAIDELSIVNVNRIPTARLQAALATFTQGQPGGGQSKRGTDLKQQKEIQMNLKERLLALFGRAPEVMDEAEITPLEIEAAFFEASAIDPAVQARLDQLESTTQTLRDQVEAANLALVERYAAEFADRAILQERKALPAERAELIGLYRMAAEADGGGSAQFSAEGVLSEGANVRLVRSLIDKRRPLALFSATIPDRGESKEPLGGAERKAKAERDLAGSVAAYNRRR